MKKVSKAILIGLAIVLALVVALLVGLNLYIQSPGAQARIQEELSKALRLPLEIKTTSLTPWSDLRITGISIPNGDANFLEATSFSARYRLLPLLDGKLVIPEMQVENPKVVWFQNEKGKWKLPEPEKAAEDSLEATNAVAEPPPEVAKVEKEKRDPAKKKDFAVIINRFEIKNGSFDLLDKERRPVGQFSGVNMIYTKLTAEHVEGNATIARAVWADGVTFENVSTPFSYIRGNHEFWLPEFTATLAGGSLRGSYHSRAEAEHTPFNAKVTFERINVDQLVTQGGGDAGQATGTLSGNFEMRGETDRMEKAEGEGHLDLREGRFSQLDLFQNIGHFLSIAEFSDLSIREGRADFRLAGEKIIIEKLELRARSLDLSASGDVRLDKEDKKIALEARLTVDEAVAARLPGNLPEVFAPDGQGRRMIAFTIGGTTKKPKTNLHEKLISQTISAQFGNVLGTIFDEKKEEEQRKKKEEEKRRKEEDERKKAEKKDKKKKDKDKNKGAASADAISTPAPGVSPATPAPATPPATPPNP